MTRICCFADIDAAMQPMLSAALLAAGESEEPRIATLDVRALGVLRPDVLIGDLDHLEADPLERLRQIRFVLPTCTIVVYSGEARPNWGRDCHMAGANCLLSKRSSESELSAGMLDALTSGCYTDPRFLT